MKTIKLTRGKVAIVDDSLFDLLNAFSWYAQKPNYVWYASRDETRVDGSRSTVFMHRLIAEMAGMDMSQVINHRDGDGLNNQTGNLRSATTAQSIQNQRMKRNNTSGYRGVNWNRPNRKWMALIMADGKRFNLGCYPSKVEAALAYDAAARLHHGEFARLNFPNNDEAAAVA